MIATPTPTHPGRDPRQIDRVRMFAANFRDARERRDVQIREAREQGHTLRAIGDAAGLSYEQVRRICAS